MGEYSLQTRRHIEFSLTMIDAVVPRTPMHIGTHFLTLYSVQYTTSAYYHVPSLHRNCWSPWREGRRDVVFNLSCPAGVIGVENPTA